MKDPDVKEDRTLQVQNGNLILFPILDTQAPGDKHNSVDLIAVPWSFPVW